MAPGTWGALAASLTVGALHLAAAGQERLIVAILLGIVLVPAVAASGAQAQATDRSDPSEVVIDEVLGQWVCLCFLEINFFSLCVGFLTFRIFDIWKPFPIRAVEGISGGFGIVGDDIVAGVYAGLFSKVLLWFWAAG